MIAPISNVNKGDSELIIPFTELPNFPTEMANIKAGIPEPVKPINKTQPNLLIGTDLKALYMKGSTTIPEIQIRIDARSIALK